MHSNKLKRLTDNAFNELSSYESKHGSLPFIISIKNQLKFISESAGKGLNPSNELGADQAFTFAILSSRNFSSHEELAVKSKIDLVAKELT